MAQSPDWNQLLETGRHFGEMTRAEAERRVQELIRRGELAQERFQATVDELLARSRAAADDLRDRGRQSADELREMVRTEISRQMKALGVVTREQLARVEARLTARRGGAKRTTAKKSGAKKTTAKKASKSTGAKRSGTKKTTA